MKRLVRALVTAVVVLPVVFSGTAGAFAYQVQVNNPGDGSTITDTTPTFSGTVNYPDAPIGIFVDGVLTDGTNADFDGNWELTLSTALSYGTHTVKALWPKNFFAFISNDDDHNVSIIATPTDEVLGDFTIDSSANLQDVVLTPDHTKAYIIDYVNGFWVVDVNTYDVSSTPIATKGVTPVAADINPDGSRVFIVEITSQSMSVVDTSDDSVSGPYDIGGVLTAPSDIAVRPVTGDRAYIADHTNDNLVVVDLNDPDYGELTLPVLLSCDPSSVAFDPTGTTAYVSESCLAGGSIVEIVDVESGEVTDSISNVGGADYYPQSLAITPDGSKVLVTNGPGGKLDIIDTSDLSVTSLAVGEYPCAVQATSDSRKAYVTNMSDSTVSVIDLQSDTVKGDPIPVGQRPTGLGILEDLYYSDEITFSVAAPAPEIQPAENPVAPTTPVVNRRTSVSDVTVASTAPESTEILVTDQNVASDEGGEDKLTDTNTPGVKKDDVSLNLVRAFEGAGLFLLLLLLILAVRYILKQRRDRAN